MRFDIEIPDPSNLRVSHPIFKVIPAGTLIHRVHHNDYDPTQFNPTHRGNARFSPIRTSDDDIIPTIYAGETFSCAVSEIVLRMPDALLIDPNTGKRANPVISARKFREFRHSCVRTTRDLRVLDLSTRGQRQLGVDHNALIAGAVATYPATRAWAEAIHEVFPTIDGLHYPSHQVGPEFAVVLFGTRASESLDPISTIRLNERSTYYQIQEIARKFGMSYSDI